MNNKISNLTLLKLALVFGLFLMSCSSKNYRTENIPLESLRSEDYAAMPEPKAIPTDAGGVVDPEIPIEHNTEEYDRIYENAFMDAGTNPFSTFSIDVDNASYSNVRRFLDDNQLPPPDAVRIEEMINYFTYAYAQPDGEHPFSFFSEVAGCPWNTQNKLLHIGIQGKKMQEDEFKPSNLVLLVDASGSMSSDNKLPLLQKSLGLLLDELGEQDRVAIVAYAGAAGLVLPSTPASSKDKILKALNKLSAGGSTAGGEGIQLAYQIALNNLIEGGNNRVILCTDGDFNVGLSSPGDLVRLIEEKRKDDIYLTLCGFGMGNYKDGRMEQISNAGNGNYFYIDDIREAKKVFVTEMRANMFTIAKDVKIQIEFNPAEVKAYRLIGYENRVLAKEDFNDDTKDAGELGAGHTVTALYEIVPAGTAQPIRKADAPRYQTSKLTSKAHSGEMGWLKFRYKPIDSDQSILVDTPMLNVSQDYASSSENLRFSASVAGFGMLLRGSEHKGDLTYSKVLEMAKSSKTFDPEGYRNEFVGLVATASLLAN